MNRKQKKNITVVENMMIQHLKKMLQVLKEVAEEESEDE